MNSRTNSVRACGVPRSAPVRVCPSGITTIIGRARPAAMRLSTMTPARPSAFQD